MSMFGRSIRFIPIGVLLLQMGCAGMMRHTYSIKPEPGQKSRPQLPIVVKVKLKNKILLKGTYAWRTNHISGELFAWNDETISIRRSGWSFEVPIEEIEYIVVNPPPPGGEGCLENKVFFSFFAMCCLLPVGGASF
jgi:hypothetical protein